MPKGAEITGCVREFYCLQAVELLARADKFLRSHERWVRDFQEYKQRYTENLANAMLDYSVLVCFGEMRHGAQYCSRYNPNVPYARERDESYRSAIQFTPDSILDSAYSLFTEGEWDISYGGAAWALIAEVALNRLRQKDVWCIDEVFIDRCVDLSHNGSIYFDKTETGIFWLMNETYYKAFLYRKRYSPPEVLLRSEIVSETLSKLIKRAICLKIIPDIIVPAEQQNNEELDVITNYARVEWGETILRNELEWSDYDDEDYEEDEEETYDEETEGWEEYDDEEEYDYIELPQRAS